MQKQCQQEMKKGTSTFHVTKCADPGRSNSGCVCIWMRCPGPFQTTCNPVGSKPPDTHVEYTYTHKEEEREGEERDRQRAREREIERETEGPSVRFRSATGLATCQSKWSVEVRFPSSDTPAVPICAEPIRHHCPSRTASLSGPWRLVTCVSCRSTGTPAVPLCVVPIHSDLQELALVPETSSHSLIWGKHLQNLRRSYN
jgi:hypothetical protein